MTDERPDLQSPPATISAVRLHRPGDAASLVHERIQTPRPGPREVLIRVHAAAITRDELDWPADRCQRHLHTSSQAQVSSPNLGTMSTMSPSATRCLRRLAAIETVPPPTMSP
jgi:hypothetical protein